MAITGPLIRVLGERYNWSIKSAILDALYFLLLKVDITLKPFLPQLQPTFMKNLTDVNRLVRVKAGCALAKLLLMNPRLDQLVMDIANLLTSSGKSSVVATSANITGAEITPEVKETLCNTLRLCLNNVGSRLAEETRTHLARLLISDDYAHHLTDETVRNVSGGALGSLLIHLPKATSEPLINQLLTVTVTTATTGPKTAASTWAHLHGHVSAVAAALRHSPAGALFGLKEPSAIEPVEKKLVTFLVFSAQHDKVGLFL
jgi:HEAT repeat protein